MQTKVPLQPSPINMINMSKVQIEKTYRSLATRFNDKGEMIMRKEPRTLSESDINRLDRLSTLFAPKQSYLVNLNENLKRNLTELEAFDNDILESEEVDGKLTQNIDIKNQFVKRLEHSSEEEHQLLRPQCFSILILYIKGMRQHYRFRYQ